VNPFDAAAIALVVFAFIAGLRSGVFPQLGGLVGAAIGGGGALLALPSLHSVVDPLDPPVRALLVVGGLILAVAAGEGIGSALGHGLSARLDHGVLGSLDRGAGGLLGIAQGLLIVWLAGGLLAAGPVPRASAWAQTSVVVRGLNTVLPPPTALVAGLGRILDASGLPQVFIGLEPFPAQPVPTPTTAEAERIAAAAEISTVRVTADACDFEVTGTGFAVAAGYLVTNAHVVAGSRRTTVTPEGGNLSLGARVVLFDPALDIAMLYVPELNAPALRFASVDPARGADGAALGHPLGGPLVVIPAGVTGRYPAKGRDIYGVATVDRTIIELRAQVERGDSGGPLVLADGTVGGVVFAESKSDDAVGYALSPTTVSGRVTPAIGRTSAVNTGACTR
jgi:S1-C subfamily serine protease